MVQIRDGRNWLNDDNIRKAHPAFEEISPVSGPDLIVQDYNAGITFGFQCMLHLQLAFVTSCFQVQPDGSTRVLSGMRCRV